MEEGRCHWGEISAVAEDIQLHVAELGQGHLLPVDHLQEKIRAVLAIPELSKMIVAAEQSEVEAGSYDRLRIWKINRAVDPQLRGCPR